MTMRTEDSGYLVNVPRIDPCPLFSFVASVVRRSPAAPLRSPAEFVASGFRVGNTMRWEPPLRMRIRLWLERVILGRREVAATVTVTDERMIQIEVEDDNAGRT